MRYDLRSVVCCLLVAAVVVTLTCVQHPAGAWIWGVVELALLWLVGVGLMILRRTDLCRLDAAALVAFAALIAWTGLSVFWSLDPGESAVSAQQRLVGFGVLAAVLLAARRRDAPAVLGGVLGGCAAVCLMALIRCVAGGAPLDQPLSWPVGYSNALALMAGMGTLLALALATREGSPRGARRLGAIAVPPMAVTLVLTGSVGAVAATLLGLVVLVALLPRERPVLAGVVLLTVTALVVSTVVSESEAQRSRPALQGGMSVSARVSLWGVALRSVPDSPIAGTGAGSFERLWLRDRRTGAHAYSAHNLYLETLAELGVVGLALVAVVLAAPLVALRRGVDPEAAGGVAAYVAFLVHAAVDVDWHLPVLAVTGVLCGAGVLLAARPHAFGRTVRLPTRLGALAVVAGLGGFAYAGFMSAAAMSRSEEAAARWSFDAALVEAQSAATWAPWSGEPWQALGRVAVASGELGRARASFRRGVSIDPADAELWRGLARATKGPARRLAAARAATLDPLARNGIEEHMRDRTARRAITRK